MLDLYPEEVGLLMEEMERGHEADMLRMGIEFGDGALQVNRKPQQQRAMFKRKMRAMKRLKRVKDRHG